MQPTAATAVGGCGILRRTSVLHAARTAFQNFGQMQGKRDPDYIKIGNNMTNLDHMFGGYMFPQSTFNFQKSFDQKRGTQGVLPWYTTMGMKSRPSTSVEAYKDWYRQAMGTVEYLDGYEYPELQTADDLHIESNSAPVVGRIPLTTTGRAREFAEAVEALRRQEGRDKADLDALFAKHVVWSSVGAEDVAGGESADVLRGQPSALFEVLLIMCAEHGDWINVVALLREIGSRGVDFRSVVMGALFEHVDTAQNALNLFEVMKKESVRLHLHSYLAFLRALERLEMEEKAGTLNAHWHEKGEVTGDMLAFIMDGGEDKLFPQSPGFNSLIDGSDPKEDVDAAIATLMAKDKAVLRA